MNRRLRLGPPKGAIDIAEARAIDPQIDNRQGSFIYGSPGGDDDVTVTPSGTSPDDPNAAVKRDYELALQIGTLAVWDSFISHYPNGVYADLARAQRSKLLAEQERLQAAEKAKAASEENARLAAEGAAKTTQQKASAKAQSAERARVRAEKLERERKQEDEREKAIREAREVKKPSSVAAQTTITSEPTCSQAHAGCARSRSRFGAGIVHNCESLFAKCMQTGVWEGTYSHFEGLARR
jgi:flagellar biosynthesis GTPase FlhF